jgi:hypothetical protein
MRQLGLSLNEDDIHAMMRSVGVGPNGKISFSGRQRFLPDIMFDVISTLCLF